MKLGNRVIKGVKPSARYQRYFDRINVLYFDGSLSPARVYTAPLLKITSYTQAEAENEQNWLDAGEYGIVCIDENDEQCILVDRGTSIFHALMTKQTIIHEAIHINLSPYRGHGWKFKKEIRRVAALGAFDTLI